jgi:hypothetical protein
MNKIKLDLDRLHVDSFPTTAADDGGPRHGARPLEPGGHLQRPRGDLPVRRHLRHRLRDAQPRDTKSANTLMIPTCRFSR